MINEVFRFVVHSFISNSDISSEVGTDSSSLALGNEDVPESLEDVPVENDVLLAMQQLLEHCDYGSLCCSRIMTLYKISQVVELQFIVFFTMSRNMGCRLLTFADLVSLVQS